MLKHCQATAADLAAGRRSRRGGGSNNGSFNSSFASIESSSSSSSSSSCERPPSVICNSSAADSRRSSYSPQTSTTAPPPSSFLSAASRASSVSTLASLLTGHNQDAPGPKTVIKVFCRCLRPDVEYKTLSVGRSATSRELIWSLLSKFRMRHRDPNLFYLTMDMGGGSSDDDSSSMVLEDDARPAELQSCHPSGAAQCRFTLRSRRGALVRVHDSEVAPESRYKCLLVAERTTAREVAALVLRCYATSSASLSPFDPEQAAEEFCLVERCGNSGYERRLHPADRPAEVQALWPSGPSNFQFVLRKTASNDSSSNNSSNSGLAKREIESCGSSDDQAEVESMDVSSSSSSSSSTRDDCTPSPTPSPVSVHPPPPAANRPTFRLSGLVTSSPIAPVHKSTVPSSSASPTYASLEMTRHQRHRFLLQQSGFGHHHHYGHHLSMAPIRESVPMPQQQQQQQQQHLMEEPTYESIYSSRPSIHESGLPPPPPLKPKSQAGLAAGGAGGGGLSSLVVLPVSKRASLGSLSSGSRSSNASFHEYENYFYI